MWQEYAKIAATAGDTGAAAAASRAAVFHQAVVCLADLGRAPIESAIVR